MNQTEKAIQSKNERSGRRGARRPERAIKTKQNNTLDYTPIFAPSLSTHRLCGNKKERREEGRLWNGGPSSHRRPALRRERLPAYLDEPGEKDYAQENGAERSRGDAEEAIVSIREERKERLGQEVSGGAQKRGMTVLVGIPTMKKGKEGLSEAQERRYRYEAVEFQFELESLSVAFSWCVALAFALCLAS